MSLLAVAPDVADALARQEPVVALESTLITHGLPAPRNVEAARHAEAAVRAESATPATVAVHDGRIRVGLSNVELEKLSAAQAPIKASSQNLAWALGRPGWAGTTVSATMIAAQHARIRVFATGGIGGVHRGGERSLDISADLSELGRTPVAVVCAGPKSILDVARTLEVLETAGVPVISWGTDEVPGFFSRSSGVRAPARVDTAAEAAGVARRHWELGRAGLLFCVPLPEAAALPADEVRDAVDQAIAEAESGGVHGPAATPFVLARVAELTGGRTVSANLALIEHNARIAAQLAVALSRT